MSILDRLFGTYEETLHEDWKNLSDEGQLNQIIKDSFEKGIVIFKHSTRCGTSAMAKHMLESAWDFGRDELDFYYLDIFAHRPISNLIAKKFKVVHHSPQIIIIKNGEAAYDTSHHNISIGNIRKAL